ncbi:phytanoyl-CoA dioxygenase family protein [Actinacidiphila bryophytorum]|uniref:phytanoyl-CoA dioxygenase family protein n=1 Tax=Actinacidiphila bryophytorum TaxID=1436133 RepID=UPI002176A641|nr:phytanoyl-CoA dioxygenase family protein [Actinacidiphila bryophytorum]UWE09506.1 phytanoyl-CoA dioxygenase family protein [Actinacidiphila bryophytorum]
MDATAGAQAGQADGTGMAEAFLRDGFVKIAGAFSAEVARECAALLWQETGCDPDDPATWTKPVHWVGGMAQPPFAAAANTPVLHAAFDLLVGPGRWVRRDSLGSFPLRFPHEEEPDDAGWHIEGSYLPDGATWYFTNLRSRDRALLMLFLFTDVDEHNAPTRIRVGSHLDIPPLLAPYGEAGVSGLALAPALVAASEHRPVALATGRAGDVFLCHPFLVHAAQPHHGSRPRFMAQPPLHPAVPLELERADGAYSPVESAIRQGLGAAGGGGPVG